MARIAAYSSTTLVFTQPTAPTHHLNNQHHSAATSAAHAHTMRSNPGVLAGVILGIMFITAVIPASIILGWRKCSSLKAAQRKAAEERRKAKGKGRMTALERPEGTGTGVQEGDIEMGDYPRASSSAQDSALVGDGEVAGNAGPVVAAGPAMPKRGVAVARAVAKANPLPGISTRSDEDQGRIVAVRAVAGEADVNGMGWRGEGLDLLRNVGKGTVKRLRRMRDGKEVIVDEEAEVEGETASGECPAAEEEERERGYYEQARQGFLQLQHLCAAEQAGAVRDAYSAAAASRPWGSPA